MRKIVEITINNSKTIEVRKKNTTHIKEWTLNAGG